MKVVLGTMNFGPQVDLFEATDMVRYFLDQGNAEIDTAYVYNHGDTESMLGKILPNLNRNTFSIATKANPRITGRLDKAAIRMQCHESLERMKLDKVDILYLHMPDANTPIEESLEACALLHEENSIGSVGLSNFPAWLVAHCWHVCDENGWPKPIVYQGLYNGISRKVENELFSCLHEFKIKFYAFNPLAGGLLTGKQLNYDADPEKGRFSRLESYRKRYWKKSYFDAIMHISKECNESGIKPAEAAYRWLVHHSFLNEEFDDAILIGASSMEQFKFNLEAAKSDDLPENIVEAFNLAWENAMLESPEYFYYHNSK
ncbi:aldo/keto reductase family protein [Pararhodonellum marinum]|uniref:aldo/keto reductase family protein n=1 Tax=Pararhodonellum marinum TaxID=2755358 RepID=UPI00188E0AA7|nr:aldo/keto reductase [Pararhodonellum marinum]